MIDRTQPPPFVSSKLFHLPHTKRIRLPNGIKFCHISNVKQKIAVIEVIFEAGKRYDSLPGTAYFMARMLEKGTDSMSASQIANLLEQYGAEVKIRVDFDVVTITLYTLYKHLKNVFPCFFKMLTKSIFPKPELQQLQDATVQSLFIKNEKTDYIASKIIQKKIFGENHPYSKFMEPETIKNITQEHTVAFFKKYMQPAHIFVLGNISQQDLAYIQEYFSPLQMGNVSKKIDIPTPQINPSQWLKKNKSVQSSIRLGKKTVTRKHPDYFDIVFLNYHLGGYFGSQLMQNLREKRGLTYSISSTISHFKWENAVVIAADVNRENRNSAIDEIRNELKKISDEQIKKDQLECVKNYFIGSLNNDIKSPFAIMNKIKNIVINELPEDFYEQLSNRIQDLSTASLTETANAYFNQHTFHEVAVG